MIISFNYSTLLLMVEKVQGSFPWEGREGGREGGRLAMSL